MSSAQAIWHEVECGGYEADLRLWADLAARFDGAVLDIGAGTGRVSSAYSGHVVGCVCAR